MRSRSSPPPSDIYSQTSSRSIMKTKNFHWHMTGRHFRDYHLLLDEHAEQILGMSDDIAERARKLGATTLRSIGDISRHQRLEDNNDEAATPDSMLSELHNDNRQLTAFLRQAREVCAKGTTSPQQASLKFG